MVTGVGVDAVSIPRLARVIARTPRFVDRVFTIREREDCRARGRPEASLAARFAAKEACRKALGEVLAWQDMEVRRDEDGKPSLHVAGRSGGRFHVSLTHTDDLAVAFVVAEDDS